MSARVFGSTGDCFDNAAMGTFWLTIKRARGDHYADRDGPDDDRREIAWSRGSIWFPTRRAARVFLFEWFEVFYNRQRHQTVQNGSHDR